MFDRINIIPFFGEALLGSKLTLTTLVDRIGLSAKASRCQDLFASVRTYCMFIGNSRSGHGVISSLIDAHPDALVAHRIDALRFVPGNLTALELFFLIRQNSRRFAKTGRRLTGYKYEVSGQWQGRFRTLKVIGEDEAKWTARKLNRDPLPIQEFFADQSIELKFIHVIRNPYDNITTMAMKTNTGLKYNIKRYFSICHEVSCIRERLQAADLLDLRHERFLEDPAGGLGRVCSFLDLDKPQDYIRDCSAIVYSQPHQSRFGAKWPPALVETVRSQMARFDFLDGYSYES